MELKDAVETSVESTELGCEEIIGGEHRSKKRKLVTRDDREYFADRPYTVRVNSKHAATGRWHEALGLVEIISMRGNFWTKMGFTVNQKNFLYPEEALYLVERAQLFIDNKGGVLPSSLFYELVAKKIELAVYLTYVKLKVGM
jgi:hypothetical protein